MGCELIREKISDYYFGAISRPEREAIDRHLLDCRACLSEFLELKDAVETGGEGGEAPGPEARARLFRAVAETFASPPFPHARRRPASWRGSAWLAAGMALVLALGAGGWLRFLRERPLAERTVAAFHPVDTADTGQTEPVSFNVF